MSVAPLQLSYSPMLACLRGNQAQVPIDPTTDHVRVIPFQRGVSKMNIGNTDYSERKPVTFQLSTAKGYTFGNVFVTDTMPPIYAKNKTDKVAYCDYPAIHQIRTIECKVGNAQTETLTPALMLKRLSKIYKDNIEEITNEFLGGCSEFNSKNQIFQGLTSFFDNVDYKKNILKPAFSWRLPIVSSILTNPEKFRFSLAVQSLLEFTINFNVKSNFVSKSVDLTLDEHQGALDIYTEWLMPNDHYRVFNNLAHMTTYPDTNYYVNDRYTEYNEKKFTANQEWKVIIRPGPTQNFTLFISDLSYNSSNKFFGTTVQEAASNFIAAHITNSTAQTSLNLTFNLATGLFGNGTPVTTGGWSIVNFNVNTGFILRFQKNSTQSYDIKVTCSSPLNSFGDLYFDIDQFSNDTSLSAPKLYYFDSFNLDIKPYDATNTSYANSEDANITLNQAKMLINGYFTFNNVAGVNQNAFWAVNNIVQAPACSDLLYDFALSKPVSNTANSVNPLLNKRFVFINRPIYSYYDLNKKHNIRCEELIWEKTSGMQEIWERNQILFFGDLRRKTVGIKPNLYLNFSFKDYDNDIDSLGYFDMQIEEYTHQTIKPTSEELIFDQQSISDTIKEKTALSHQYNLVSYQDVIRTLKYDQNSTLNLVSHKERYELNIQLINSVLKQSEMYTDRSDFAEQPQPKKIKTAYGPIDDRASFNNGSVLMQRPELPNKYSRKAIADSKTSYGASDGGFGAGFASM